MTKWTVTWNKTSLTSTQERADSRRKLMKRRNLKWGISWECNYSWIQWSGSPTSFVSITATTVFPSTNINGIRLKIHLWLLPVGCREKQQPAGRKRGVSISNLPTVTSPLELWNECYENKVLFLEDFSPHLNIIRKQHSFKGADQEIIYPNGADFLTAVSTCSEVRYFGKNTLQRI